VGLVAPCPPPTCLGVARTSARPCSPAAGRLEQPYTGPEIPGYDAAHDAKVKAQRLLMR
jgi:hypothetical protein